VTRERLLVDIYLGTTVLVIDATHSDETSPTAVNLAVVTAQVGHDVQLIVPAGSDDFREHLTSALDLEEARGGAAASAVVPALRVFTASDSGDERQGDLLLTEQTHAAIDSAGDDTLTFLVLPSSAHPASILAGLRLSQSVVVVTREHDTTTTEIRWLKEEAEAIDTAVLGAVAEHRVRRGRRDVGISWPFPTRAERGTAARANARAAAKVEVGADS
jgi:hypothetical protein